MADIRYLRKMIDGVPVVTAPPEIDITCADQLRAVLLDTAARGHATVVVDLTLTRFCDSYGLHALLRAHKLARADGGELRLVTAADGVVPRIFALTCLDRLIPCFASLKRGPDQHTRREPPSRCTRTRRGPTTHGNGYPRRQRGGRPTASGAVSVSVTNRSHRLRWL